MEKNVLSEYFLYSIFYVYAKIIENIFSVAWLPADIELIKKIQEIM